MTTASSGTRSRAWLLAVALLLIIVAPRLLSVGQLGYLQAQWWLRSPDFFEAVRAGRFEGTFQSSHPGVTMMWLLGAGLWIGERVGGPLSPLQQLCIVDLIQILWTSVLTLVLFFILWRVLVVYGEERTTALWVSWLACVVLALDPMWLTFTQVVSLDAPMAALAAIAVLLTLYALRTGSLAAMAASGAAAALAVLTKLPALIFVAGIALALVAAWLGQRSSRTVTRDVVRPGLVAGAAFVVTVVACWPAMWTAPLATIEQTLTTPEQSAQIRRGEIGAVLRGTPEQRGLHALLDVVLHPERPGDSTVIYRRTRSAALYYPAVVWFKSTPLTIIGILSGVGLLLTGGRRASPSVRLMLHLGCFAALYFLCMSVAAKKIWRYMVPFLAFLELAAGLAIAELSRRAAARWGAPRAFFACALALALQFAHVLSHYPYFIVYFNPLSGGRAVAEQYVAFDWGEGIGEAARYMEAHARSRPVRFFTPIYPQRVLLMMHDGMIAATVRDAEFVVVTSREFADLTLTPELQQVWDTQRPEHEVRIFGVPYAWVFRVADRGSAGGGTTGPSQ